jgi:hypothetical protein
MKRKNGKQQKRSEPTKKANTNAKPSFQHPEVEDDEITSESTYLSESEEMSEDKQGDKFSEREVGEEIKETHDEMKARIARAYLEKLDALHKFDESEEEDRIGSHLEKEFVCSRLIIILISFTLTLQIFSKKSISTFKPRADLVADLVLSSEHVRFKKGHQLPVTCLALSFDGSHLYTGSKDCCVVQCMSMFYVLLE